MVLCLGIWGCTEAGPGVGQQLALFFHAAVPEVGNTLRTEEWADWKAQ